MGDQCQNQGNRDLGISSPWKIEPDNSEACASGATDQSRDLRKMDDESTESIDLSAMLTKDLTDSGSFDIKGEILASTFGKLLQTLPAPCALIDQDFEIMIANQACQKIGAGPDRLENRSFLSLFPDPDERRNLSQIVNEVFQTRKPESVKATLKIGRTDTWARLNFRSMRVAGARCLMALIEDLTHERNLLLLSINYQKELKKQVMERTSDLSLANEQLRKEILERERAEKYMVQTERLRAVGEMSAGVAHNFNNLLQMLTAVAHSTLQHIENNDINKAGNRIRSLIETLKHGAQTIKRLSEFSKYNESTTDTHSEIFDLSELVREAADITSPFWETYPRRKGQKVTLKTSLAHRPQIKGERGQILEVIVNLIKNAAEAIQEDGEISISTKVETGCAIFTIRDTGSGISEENMKRLFTPFFTTKPATGTGLGLATSKSIVKTHGGSMDVQSEFNKETTITVTLPLFEQGCAGDEMETEPQEPESMTILAVDDEEKALAFLKDGLEGCGHRVITASSGQEALEYFKNNTADIILSDLSMPGMSGWDLGANIQGYCRQTDICKPTFILFTGWKSQADNPKKLREAGVDAVLAKPMGIRRLNDRISQIHWGVVR